MAKKIPELGRHYLIWHYVISLKDAGSKLLSVGKYSVAV